MKRTKFYAICGVVGLLAGAGAFGAAAASADAPYDIDQFQLTVPEKQGNQALNAVLPEPIDASTLYGGELVADSLAELGQEDDAHYFTATNRSGELCLVVATGGLDWAIATTCTSPDQFNAQGLGVQLDTPSAAAEGYLVSDKAADALRSTQLGDGASLTQSNLVVVNSDATVTQEAAVDQALEKADILMIGAE